MGHRTVFELRYASGDDIGDIDITGSSASSIEEGGGELRSEVSIVSGEDGPFSSHEVVGGGVRGR